nr:Chain A, Lipopolysaccharide biosynthesis protein wbpB [Thermus thermophilus HB27]3O9Z_B Chain B, Lipopolysaccharide biosynthesis protein wbpB [Thermus thermophilus HB27]3O9Z_C Chain C, Lipopolysaccharide biosynthesis protein wbpB [Thermus thermophilus HB27]3O9Z_D Chain D, Lipopolysaccharide biosynthesis protein wbpB [Thermus thermophilus HB27]3OA0_A Chain A, Lipopolysaccharide biosynthesis protein wbpB [Thermus thermophilus HB27]3OA0_B Chain B, Lipopolysaccharide biosynthesis protein wbpB [
GHMTRFALTGLAGYIAPRHLKAIKEVGGVLVASLDPATNVGLVDSFFPEAEFFTEPEAFEAYLEDLRDRGEGVDYLSIASPNHLHYPQIRMALRLGANALSEKPLVLWPEEIARLKELEARTGRRVYTVLQLRVHPSLLALKERLGQEKGAKDVVLTYVTGRGKWYGKSWKVDEAKSGGLATNIGIHFFDLLAWLFGRALHVEVHARTPTVNAGYLELEGARVRWFLSIDPSFVPEPLRRQGKRTYRSIAVDGEEVEFSEGFTDLHTEVYRKTLAGEGFGLDEAAEAIRVAALLRTLPLSQPSPENRHPFLG